MKPMRNIIILVLVILLLSGGFYFVLQYEPEQEDVSDDVQVQTVTIFSAEKSEIASLRIQNFEETYTVSKGEGEAFILNDNPAIKAKQSRIETLLYECASITGRDLLEENVQDLSQYGLDAPKRSVAITFLDGSTQSVLIGNETIDGSVCYLMLEGETKVYTKSASGCESLTPSIQKLLDTEIYAMASEDLGAITIKRPGAEEIRLVREQAGTAESGEPAYNWMMEAPLQKMANAYNIEDILTNLLEQTAVQVIPQGSQSGTYGFDTPQAEYSIKSLDGATMYAVTVGDAEGENTYLRVEKDTAVYLVKTEKLDFLQKSYLDFVDKLIHLENINDIQNIEISGEGKSYLLDIKEAENQYRVNGKAVEEDAFKRIYQAISGLMLDDFSGWEVQAAPTYTITYTKYDGTKTEVSCISYDDRNYLVKVNGAGNLLLRKKQIDTMISVIDATIA